MNIPNSISILRIVLIPFFIVIYIYNPFENSAYIAAGILAFSGLSDVVDGIIARKFNMVTELGKLLDPLADKLTLAAVCIALIVEYPQFWVVIIISFIKDFIMGVAAFGLIGNNLWLVSSKWFGKLSTVIFYSVAIIVVGFSSMLPVSAIFVLLVITSVFMIFSFVMYIPVFVSILTKKNNNN